MNIKLNVQEISSLFSSKLSIEQIAPQVAKLAANSGLLLPPPVPGTGYLQWALPGDGWKPISKACENEREEVAGEYKRRCESLQNALSGSPIQHSVVQVPTSDYIFYRYQEGKWEIALVAWGYRFPETPPCSELEAWIVKTPHQKVKIGFLWNGDLLHSIPFYFNGFKRLTQEDGFFYVDNLIPVGKTYPVETMSGEHFILTVEEGKEEYIYDLTQSFTVQVSVIRDDNPVEGVSVSVSFDNAVYTLTTEALGQAMRKIALLPGQDGTLLIPQPECKVCCEGEDIVIVPQKKGDVLAFNFSFKTPVEEKPPLPPVKEDPPTPHEEPSDITIRLFDYAGKPLPNLPFVLVTQRHGNLDLVTDGEGCCMVSRKGFAPREKMKVRFKVTKEYQEKHDLYSALQSTK